MLLNHVTVQGFEKNLKIEQGKITAVSDLPFPDGTDCRGKRLIPGLIDVHTHGCIGYDTMDGNFEPMCRFYAEHGTTTWLPTTMTMDFDSLHRATGGRTDFKGANIAGFHLEGPYISMKYKGAQNADFIRRPSIAEYQALKNIKMISMAPEIEGSEEFIRAVSPECVISIGHSDCSYEQALSAIEWGASCLTHTYNAMPPFHHRKPGPIGAAMEKNIYAQLICDGFHISKPVVLATYRMFGPERVVIISDSLCCAGMPDGEYESGGLKVYLKDGAARLADGTIAGSVATMWDCVQKAVEFGIPFDDAVQMASQTPAELLGLKKGKIEVGYDADLLLLDCEGKIETVIIGGEIYQA